MVETDSNLHSEYLTESELQKLAETIPEWTRISTSKNRESYIGHPPVENISLRFSCSNTRASERYSLTAQVTEPLLLLGECSGETAERVFYSVQKRYSQPSQPLIKFSQTEITEFSRDNSWGLWVKQPKWRDARALLTKQG